MPLDIGSHWPKCLQFAVKLGHSLKAPRNVSMALSTGDCCQVLHIEIDVGTIWDVLRCFHVYPESQVDMLNESRKCVDGELPSRRTYVMARQRRIGPSKESCDHKMPICDSGNHDFSTMNQTRDKFYHMGSATVRFPTQAARKIRSTAKTPVLGIKCQSRCSTTNATASGAAVV